MGNKSLRKECLENLDWDRVHDVMTHLQWTWEYVGIPSTEKLIHTAECLLKRAKTVAKNNKSDGYASTGGFIATAWFNRELGKVDGYSLHFVLTGWDAFVDD